MPINRYDVPAQMPTGQQFFQLPYNELASALLSKQKVYDEQEANIAKQKAFLADLKSGYRTAGLPQEIQSTYNPIFESYLGQDLTDSNVKRNLQKDLSRFSSDSRLKTLAADIQESATWDAYVKSNPAAAKAAINPYYKNGAWIPLKDDQGWVSEDKARWFRDVTPYEDPNKMIDNLFGKVKENTKNTILEEDPTATFHTDKDGKEYYLSKKTGDKATYITPNLPQWQSAAKQAEFELTNSNSPEANYFKANYADFISKDPNFIKNYISTAGGKFVYNKEEKTEDYTLKNAPGGRSNTNNTDKDPTIAKYPLSITTGKLTDENNKPIASSLELSRVIDRTLGIDKEKKSNFDKIVQSTVNNLQNNYSEIYPGLEFKQTLPGSSSITVTNKNGGEIPTEVQIEVERVNSKNELFLMKMNGLKELSKSLMLESGLDPNLTFEENVEKLMGVDKYNKLITTQNSIFTSDETLKAELRNWLTKVGSPFKMGQLDAYDISPEEIANHATSPDQIYEKMKNSQYGQSISKNQLDKEYQELMSWASPMRKRTEEAEKREIDEELQNYPGIRKYKSKMDEVLNGIEMLNNDAIPIGEAIKDGTKQKTLMTVLNTALTDNVMLSDGQYIKYANKPDEKISDDDKKIVADYFSKNNTNQTGTDKSSLEHLAKRSYLYFDENENEYKLAVVIPRSGNISDGNIYLEVSPKAVKNIEQFAADTDPDFHNLKLQGYNNTFFQNLKETNGTLAYAPVPDGDFRRKIASETGKKESELQNYQIGVKRVLHPTEIIQNNGEIYNLTPGSFYFTVSEFPNAILEPKNAKSIFEFNNLYNKLKAQYNDNIPNSKIQELVTYINSSPGLKINTIYSNKDYRKLQTYTKQNTPK